MNVTVAGLSVILENQQILSNITLQVAEGELLGLVGPNGSGKSTLLRCLYRALRPAKGHVTFGDDDVWKLKAKQAGRRCSVVTQDHDLDHDYSVYEIVAMGRTPHKGLLDRDTADDRHIIDVALKRTGMDWSASRVFATLSGGERQRVLLARALTQQTPVLILDEPTNHLDVGAQLELLSLVRDLGLTTIAALHDLDHATAYCDQLVLLDHGCVVTVGKPEDVLSARRVREVFGVRSMITRHPLTGRPHFVTAPA